MSSCAAWKCASRDGARVKGSRRGRALVMCELHNDTVPRPMSWPRNAARGARVLAVALTTPFFAGAQAADSARAADSRKPVPFGIGETLEYAVRFGIARGSARLAVLGV